jgi:ABC-type multidrug transport system ATPase subunit
MIELTGISARGPAERGRGRAVLTNVTLQAERGVLAIIGARRDGTALLLDVIDGTARPKLGRVFVLHGSPDSARPRTARVSMDAPLPESLRVDEVCALGADLRREPRLPARERLAVLGASSLSDRMVRSLSVDERRTVTLAIALTSKVDVILVEEPLVALDPVAPRLVIDALRERGGAACVIVTTASARDAIALGDRLGVLTSGAYAPLSRERAHVDAVGAVSVRVVVSPSHGKSGAGALVGALSAEEAIVSVDTAAYSRASPGSSVPDGGEAVVLVVHGRDLVLLSRALTRAIGATGVDVELVEPSALPLDAIRAALAAREAAPPVGGSS